MFLLREKKLREGGETVRWFWLICLSAGALEDIKCRAVSGKLLAVCGLAGMAAAWSGGLGTHVPGLSAGMAVLAVSGLTRGAVGVGDGLFLLEIGRAHV